MSPRISVTSSGIPGAVARLDRLSQRAEDTGPLWDAIRATFHAAERERFATAAGGWWAPDLPSTRQRKATRGLDTRTLRATGALLRSLTEPDAPGSVFDRGRDTVRLGTSLERARYHQGGQGREDRRVISVTRGLRARFAQDAADWLAG